MIFGIFIQSIFLNFQMDQKNNESEEEIFFDYDESLDQINVKKEPIVEELIWEIPESPEIQIKNEESEIEDRPGSPDFTQEEIKSPDLTQEYQERVGSPDLTQEFQSSVENQTPEDESDLVFMIEEDDVEPEIEHTPEEIIKDAIKLLYNNKPKSSNKIEKQRKTEGQKIKRKEESIVVTKWKDLLEKKETPNASLGNWEYTIQSLQMEDAFKKLNIRRRYVSQSPLSFSLAVEDQIHLFNFSNQKNLPEKLNMEKIGELIPQDKMINVPEYRYMMKELMYLLSNQGFNLGFVILSVKDSKNLFQDVNIEIVPPIDTEKESIYFWIAYNNEFFDSIVFNQKDNYFVDKISEMAGLKVSEVVSPESWTERAKTIHTVIQTTKEEANSKSVKSHNFLKVINSWEERLNHIMSHHVTTVFVGESRHGKSTLINCLLGDRILPTSADIACTSSIIEICYGKDYVVEVDVFSKEEWDEYYHNLIDLLDRGESMQEVHSILSSVFGSEKNWKNQLPTQISKELSSTTKRFQVKDTAEIQKWLKIYCATKDKEKGCQIWPIVKRVKIHGPFPILKEGLNFVDLPGLHDVNTAREKITKTYIQNARYLMVCSNYASLSSSPTIRDIIQISIANGTKITFCVTMIDAINYSDVSSNHDLPDADPYKIIIYETNRLQMLSQNIIFEEMEKFYKNLSDFRKKEISSVPFFAVSGMEFNESKKKKNKYPEILNGINRLSRFIMDLANIKLLDLKHLVNHISEFKIEEKTSEIDTEKIKNEKKDFLTQVHSMIENKVKETFNDRLIQSSKEAYDSSIQGKITIF